jgi:mannitol-1-phosphate/altronate dehydrogenase
MRPCGGSPIAGSVHSTARIIAALADADTHVVTLTVTEKG